MALAAPVIDLLSQPDEDEDFIPTAPSSKSAPLQPPVSSNLLRVRSRIVSDIRRYTTVVATPPQPAAVGGAAGQLPRTSAPPPRRPLDSFLVWRRAPPAPSGVLLRGKPRALWGGRPRGQAPEAAVVIIPSDDGDGEDGGGGCGEGVAAVAPAEAAAAHDLSPAAATGAA
jgi:hypothetical protein